MYRAHELKNIEHKVSGGGQSASAKPQIDTASKGSTQKTQSKLETDKFEDPDKNIDVCYLTRSCLWNSC